MTDKDELEKIREQKRRQLKNQEEQQQEVQEAQEELQEQRINNAFERATTDEAQRRVNALKMTGDDKNEQVAETAKRLIAQKFLQAEQAGKEQLFETVTDEKMKEILRELQPEDTGYNVKWRR